VIKLRGFVVFVVEKIEEKEEMREGERRVACDAIN
jgi:hypothetical protein